jgi:hypothetical protein
LTGDWTRVQSAYDYGPLGQTADAGGFYYYGTRGALVTSGVAAGTAGGLAFGETTALARSGMGGIRIGGRPLRAYFRIDPPHHGKGPHVHVGPFEFGPKIPKHVRWPGWKRWFEDLFP